MTIWCAGTNKTNQPNKQQQKNQKPTKQKKKTEKNLKIPFDVSYITQSLMCNDILLLSSSHICNMMAKPNHFYVIFFWFSRAHKANRGQGVERI